MNWRRIYTVTHIDSETGRFGPNAYFSNEKDKRKIRHNERRNWGQSIQFRFYPPRKA